MTSQSALGTEVEVVTPQSELYGVYAGDVKEIIYTKNNKPVAFHAELLRYGPVRNVPITTNSKNEFECPQIGDRVLIAFENGIIDNPVLLRTVNFTFGETEKEYLKEFPAGMTVKYDKNGDAFLTFPRHYNKKIDKTYNLTAGYSGEESAIVDIDEAGTIKLTDRSESYVELNAPDKSITSRTKNESGITIDDIQIQINTDDSNSIKIDATAGKITVESVQSLDINTLNVLITATGNVTTQATGNIVMQATGTGTIQSTATLTLQGSQIVLVGPITQGGPPGQEYTGNSEIKGAKVTISSATSTDLASPATNISGVITATGVSNFIGAFTASGAINLLGTLTMAGTPDSTPLLSVTTVAKIPVIVNGVPGFIPVMP